MLQVREGFPRALVMPNTDTPILTGEDAVRYRVRIHEVSSLSPLITIKLTKATTPDMILRAKGAGVVAAKFYPEGMTTNFDDGARSPLELEGVLAEMEKCGMILCLHSETPGRSAWTGKPLSSGP
jgi:dihydroorotase